MTYEELAERCEQATGPDRELDCLIVETFGWKRIAKGRLFFREIWWERGNDRLWLPQIPKLTVSLDAAMTLVPEGWERFDVDATAPELGIDWTLHGPMKDEAKGTADTPALALCAAALRAIAAHQAKDQGR